MKYTIEFSEYALETFAEIKNQINNKWGYAVVVDFEQRTTKVLAIIQDAPFIYQSPAFNPNIRKAFIHKNCSMFYEIKNSLISISFFWDNRQDPIF